MSKKDKVRLVPLLSGGQQENGSRGGTVNWASHVMLAKSLRLGIERLDEHYAYVKSLKEYLSTELKLIEGLVVNSPDDSTPYILNVYFKNKRGEVIMNALSNKGIYGGVPGRVRYPGSAAYRHRRWIFPGFQHRLFLPVPKHYF